MGICAGCIRRQATHSSQQDIKLVPGFVEFLVFLVVFFEAYKPRNTDKRNTSSIYSTLIMVAFSARGDSGFS